MFWDFENSENLEYLKLPKETRFKREKDKKKKKVCILKHFSIKKQNNEISIMGENEAGAFTGNSKEFEFRDTVS